MTILTALKQELRIGPLKDFVRICGGGTPSKGRPEFYQGTIPWVSPKDFKGNEIFDTEDHITAEAISESAAKLIPAGSVLVVLRSGVLKLMPHSF
jgi:type I restriction enzyme S subunit